MSQRSALILIAAATALHAWPAGVRFLSGPRQPPAFVVEEPPSPPPGTPAFRHEEFVSPEGPDVHVGSMCELPDGRLAAAWYGGSAEGAGDVCVYFATRGPVRSSGAAGAAALRSPGEGGRGAERGSAWSEPRRIVGRDSAAAELGRRVKKVGNSVLFTDQDGRLWLVYVSTAVGGWSDSSLNVKTSTDGGATWSRSLRLTLSPLFNVSELVKNRPAMLEGGGFVLPVYHENMGLFPEMLWITGHPGGRMSWWKTRIAGGRSFIQPAVVPLGARSAVAFLRCSAPERAVGVSRTSDGGLTWTTPAFTGLPNPNSAVDALLLSGGRILLALNDHGSRRENLRLAVSADRGATWTRIATLEEDPARKFSYPYLIRTRDGLIHAVYTHRGTRIKHVAFNEAWIEKCLSRKRAKEASR